MSCADQPLIIWPHNQVNTLRKVSDDTESPADFSGVLCATGGADAASDDGPTSPDPTTGKTPDIDPNTGEPTPTDPKDGEEVVTEAEDASEPSSSSSAAPLTKTSAALLGTSCIFMILSHF